MRVVARTVERYAAVPVERLFDVVVAEDVLPHVLPRWGPVPAVIETSGLTGPWDTPGSSRTVLLGDGNRARETVLEWERPVRFRYRVDAVTGTFGRLFDHAVGEWAFGPEAAGSRFRWTYSFHVRGRPGAMLVRAVATTAWAGYMNQCADLCVARAEALSAPRSH
jgi:hypothetical protein